MTYEDPLCTILKSFSLTEKAVSTLGFVYTTEKRLLETHYQFRSGKLTVDSTGLHWTSIHGHTSHLTHKFENEFVHGLKIMMEWVYAQESNYLTYLEMLTQLAKKEVTP